MYYESVIPPRAGVNLLTEQNRSTKQRAYRKVKRAEDEQRTRARIVDAAEALHAEVGPARATISAIAERADVTRATVYRHFPDDESLFLACSGQWLSRQQLPDPDAWGAHDDPFAVLHAGLTDIYRYFRDGEPMLTSVLRDAAVVPTPVKEARLALEREWLASAAPAIRVRDLAITVRGPGAVERFGGRPDGRDDGGRSQRCRSGARPIGGRGPALPRVGPGNGSTRRQTSRVTPPRFGGHDPAHVSAPSVGPYALARWVSSRTRILCSWGIRP